MDTDTREDDRRAQITKYSDIVRDIATAHYHAITDEVIAKIPEPELRVAVQGRVHLLMYRSFFSFTIKAAQDALDKETL